MPDCPTCVSKCSQRWCVEYLRCATDCCACCHFPGLYIENADIPAGTLLGEREDHRLGPFDPSADNGLQTFAGIQMYHIVTNETGQPYDRYFIGLVPNADLCGPLYSNFYACGIFFEDHLFGDVNAAISAGRLARIPGGLVKIT